MYIFAFLCKVWYNYIVSIIKNFHAYNYRQKGLTTMIYNYENCTFYPECIAISADAAVFNVDIYHRTNSTDCTKIGKANVIVPRFSDIKKKIPNIALMIFDGKNIDNSTKLQEIIVRNCEVRTKAI